VIDQSWQEVRKILVVRLDNLGDVLLATPAIRAVKAALPEAAISLLASPNGAQAGRLNSDITEVIVHEAPWVDPWQELPHDADRERAIIDRLRCEQFDAAIIFTSWRQSPLPAAYLCYLAGIPLRLAASIDASGSLLTTRHRYPDAVMHEVERGLHLVSAIGIPPADKHLVLTIPTESRERASRFRNGLAEQRIADRIRPLVVVHPGSTMPARRYPPEQYADVIAALVTDVGAHVVITGVEAESDLIGHIVCRLAPEIRESVQDVAGALPFGDVCALIEAADLVVTNNTGPMHIAAATATPVIALFALTNRPEQWGPWLVPHRILNRDVPCRYCHARICPFDQECLSGISGQDVVAAARELGIGRSPDAFPDGSRLAMPAVADVPM
jgi:lipopolysaccharide heptosyltransferase II